MKYVTIIIIAKFAFNHEIEPNVAKISTENLLQIIENFILGYWQGAGWNSKFYRKWKNKKHSSLQKTIMDRTMFVKIQNSLASVSLRISMAGENVNVSKISL